MELDAKVEKQVEGGAGPGPRSPNSGEWHLGALSPKSSHIHDASVQNIPRDGVFFCPLLATGAPEASGTALAWVGSLAWESCEECSRVMGLLGCLVQRWA